MKPARKGTLIVIEGVDGIGKTTIVTEVEKRLVQQGVRVRRLREPGGTEIGEEVRKILVGNGVRPVDGITALLLFSASRREIMRLEIEPALERGETVILDRFYLSTYVYQGEQGVSDADIAAATKIATAGCTPDKTIILSATEEVLQQRRIGRGAAADAFDAAQDAADVSRKRMERFVQLARDGRSKGCVVVDVSGNEEANVQAVMEQIMAVIKVGPVSHGIRAGARQ